MELNMRVLNKLKLKFLPETKAEKQKHWKHYLWLRTNPQKKSSFKEEFWIFCDSDN